MTMLVFCAISNAVMFLAQKKLLRRYPCTSVTAWYYLAAGLLTAIIASRELFIDPTAFIEPFQSTLVIVALAYAVCFATVVNYEVLSWANGHTAASTVMSFAAIQTVGTTILSSVLLHTEVYMGQIVGGVGIVGGLLMVAHAPAIEVKDEEEEADLRKKRGGHDHAKVAIGDLCINFGGKGETGEEAGEETPEEAASENDRLLATRRSGEQPRASVESGGHGLPVEQP